MASQRGLVEEKLLMSRGPRDRKRREKPGRKAAAASAEQAHLLTPDTAPLGKWFPPGPFRST